MLDSLNLWCGGPSPPRVVNTGAPAVGATYEWPVGRAAAGSGRSERSHLASGTATAERPDGTTFSAVRPRRPARRRSFDGGSVWTEHRLESRRSKPAPGFIGSRHSPDTRWHGAAAGGRSCPQI